MNKRERTLPWVERHRPIKLVDVHGSDGVISALRSYKSLAEMPHLLLHGPPGSGKTSSILAIAKQFFGGSDVSSMVLELNASDVRGVDTMRNQIQYFTRCSSVTSTTAIKLVILDEADSLTDYSQCALRQLIERSTDRVRFCLCCSFVNKLSTGIRSRCTSMRFSGIAKPQLRRTLQNVCVKEGLKISSQSLDAVVDVCRGDARQAINLLQSFSLGTLSRWDDGCLVYKSCGLPPPSDVKIIFDSLLYERFSVAYETLSRLVSEKQYSLVQVIELLVESIVVCDDNIMGGDRMGTILAELANIECCLSEGGTEFLAIGGDRRCFSRG